MATITSLADRRQLKRDAPVPGTTGKILFFSGVRYEREGQRPAPKQQPAQKEREKQG